MGTPKIIPAIIFLIPKGSLFLIAFPSKIISAKIAAIPNKLPENIETSFLGTYVTSTNFKVVSIAPDPKKRRMGKSKPAFFLAVDFSFTEDKYTSDVALLKVNNNDIKNLTYKMYAKHISKIKYEPNDYYSDSDSEIDDISPFVY